MKNLMAAFLLCCFSFAAGVGVMAHIATGKLDALVQRQVQIGDQQRQAFETAQATATAWQHRAQSCEARFSTGTVIMEPHPMAELPLLHGAVTLELKAGDGVFHGELKPAWFIPAKVNVYSNVPGAQQVWQDMRTGAIIGQAPVFPPSEMAEREAH